MLFGQCPTLQLTIKLCALSAIVCCVSWCHSILFVVLKSVKQHNYSTSKYTTNYIIKIHQIRNEITQNRHLEKMYKPI